MEFILGDNRSRSRTFKHYIALCDFTSPVSFSTIIIIFIIIIHHHHAIHKMKSFLLPMTIAWRLFFCICAFHVKLELIQGWNDWLLRAKWLHGFSWITITMLCCCYCCCYLVLLLTSCQSDGILFLTSRSDLPPHPAPSLSFADICSGAVVFAASAAAAAEHSLWYSCARWKHVCVFLGTAEAVVLLGCKVQT